MVNMKTSKSIIGLICVSSDDVLYLFEYAVLSTIQKVAFIDALYIVTPNPRIVEQRLSEMLIQSRVNIIVVADATLLSKEESELCGWSKQQIIKLRSYRLSPGSDILCIGADTIILKELNLSDFYSPDTLIVNYRNHLVPNKHHDFEIERSQNICTLLGISPTPTVLRDYIFDLFLFQEEILKAFETYFAGKFGENYYLKIFPKTVTSYQDMVKTGEWTLYTLFALGILKSEHLFQDASMLVHQVHSQKEFASYDYSDKSVHFVRKDFDKNVIISHIKKYLVL